jgi:hypothetical protein
MIFYYYILTLFLILNTFEIYYCTHFRGGLLMWKPVFENESIIIINTTVKLGWRRSFGFSTDCDDFDVQARNKIIGEPGLFIEPPNYLILKHSFIGVFCTDFSETEDWSYGEITFPIQYNALYGSKIFNIHYSGASWIQLLNYGDSWDLIARVDLNKQKHTNMINHSPITSMFPLIRIPVQYYQEVKIPIIDPDNDYVKCRWSVGLECGDSCVKPANIELVSESCFLKFNLPFDIGLYAIRLQIEDFADLDSKIPLSSIPLEFLVQAFELKSNFNHTPEFEYPTKDDRTCVPLSLNSTYNDVIVVNSRDSLNPIIEIQTVAPPGLFKSSLSVFNYSSTNKYVNITWTPDKDQIGLRLFCFTGITAFLISTEQRCISFAIGYEPLEFIQSSAFPIGSVDANRTLWSISATQKISRPPIDKFIRFFIKATNQLVYTINTATDKEIEIVDSRVFFKTKEFLESNREYYINFDNGAFRSNHIGCQLNTDEIENNSYWTIHVKSGEFVMSQNSTQNSIKKPKNCEENCMEYNCLCLILTCIIGILVISIFLLICILKPINKISNSVMDNTNMPVC